MLVKLKLIIVNVVKLVILVTKCYANLIAKLHGFRNLRCVLLRMKMRLFCILIVDEQIFKIIMKVLF